MRFGLQPLNTPIDRIDPDALVTPDVALDPTTGLPPVAPVPASSDLGQTVLYAPDGEGGGAASAGGAGSGSGSTTVSAGTSASPFVIKISWDSSVSAAPTGFTAGVLAAAQYLESQFSDAVTVNISIGYGEVNGSALGSGALGSSLSYLTSTSYSNLRNALTADATSADDKSAVASLPTGAPTSGTFWTTTAEAKAIGLTAANGTSTDGFVGFSSTLPFTYSGAIAGGTYDFNGVVLHELSEVMGRIMLTGATVGSAANSYTLMDLFHYSSAGVRDFAASTPGYFSADSGATKIGTLNTTSGGDAGDWSSAMGYDAFDAFSNSGVVNPVSSADLRAVDVIGWNRAVPAALSGVAVSAVTSGLAAAQTSSGLAAGAVLAKVAEVGGPSTDSYSYALGGTGAAGFSLTGAGTSASLAVAGTALNGAAGGSLYALTITATDTTSGGTAAAAGLDVIVGSSAGDTVSVATLTGALGAGTASFVYGLGGNDTLTASGMTGKTWFVGGGGADRMTGGSGVNDYLYGAVSDSTAAAMDVITNFHAAADMIDLTGLGTALSYAGKIGATNKLAAGSVGWQVSGGNTFVYVNTSTASESLTAANMKIEMLGSLSLGTGNIVHL